MSRKKSFTLIEMLIVVVIIGILAGVLVPRIMSARERASDASRDVKVGQISTAFGVYKEDHGSYPVASFFDTAYNSISESKTASLSPAQYSINTFFDFAPSVLAASQYSTVAMVADKIGPYLSSVPTDPGKGLAAQNIIDNSCVQTGDSFAYSTNESGSRYAITSLSESKKGNTDNCLGAPNASNTSYKVIGSNISKLGGSIGKNNRCDMDTSEPGIYHCISEESIMVTDDTTSIVIADKNVGASVVGTDRTNPAIAGTQFQRGNNYGFPSNGTVSPIVTTQINTVGLTTYTSSTFVRSPIIGGTTVLFRDWSATQNDALRAEKTQGPCKNGYHIPTKDEWTSLYNTRKSALSGSISTTPWIHQKTFRETLFVPLLGARSYTSATMDGWQGTYGYYRSSTPSSSNRAYMLLISSNTIAPAADSFRAFAYSLRCFKD